MTEGTTLTEVMLADEWPRFQEAGDLQKTPQKPSNPGLCPDRRRLHLSPLKTTRAGPRKREGRGPFSGPRPSMRIATSVQAPHR